MSRYSVILVAVCLAGCAGRNRAALSKVTFEQLTVPAEALPEGCKLAPSWGLPFSKGDDPNPMTITDPEVIAFLCQFILGEVATEVATNIEAAYLAGYYDKSHNENAVHALKFKDPSATKR